MLASVIARIFNLESVPCLDLGKTIDGDLLRNCVSLADWLNAKGGFVDMSQSSSFSESRFFLKRGKRTFTPNRKGLNAGRYIHLLRVFNWTQKIYY